MVYVDGRWKGCRFVRTRRREDERWIGIHPTTLLKGGSLDLVNFGK
jgi:hypothetical protein